MSVDPEDHLGSWIPRILTITCTGCGSTNDLGCERPAPGEPEVRRCPRCGTEHRTAPEVWVPLAEAKNLYEG
jgi:hypothetical protein